MDGLLIPLQVERVDAGHARLGLPIQLDGKPVYVALDTGTQGVRVLKSVLPATNYPNAGPSSSLPLANGAQVSGAAVKLPMSLCGHEAGADRRTGRRNGELSAQRPALRRHGRLTPVNSAGALSGLFGVGAAQSDDTLLHANRCARCPAISVSAIWCTRTLRNLTWC